VVVDPVAFALVVIISPAAAYDIGPDLPDKGKRHGKNQLQPKRFQEEAIYLKEEEGVS
jgi:hypothetical protein